MMIAKKLLSDNRGMVAIMFGLSLLVILAVVGVAIDYSTITRDRVSFQDTMDSAVLAGARTTYSDEEKVQKAEAHFRAALKRQYGDVFESSKKNALNFEVLEGGTVVKGDFTIEMPTMMLGFIGQSTVTQSVTAKAKVGEVAGQVEQIDFVFCVDVSGDSNIKDFKSTFYNRLNQRLAAQNLSPIQNIRGRFLLFQDVEAPGYIGYEGPGAVSHNTGACNGSTGTPCNIQVNYRQLYLNKNRFIESRKNSSQQFFSLAPPVETHDLIRDSVDSSNGSIPAPINTSGTVNGFYLNGGVEGDLGRLYTPFNPRRDAMRRSDGSYQVINSQGITVNFPRYVDSHHGGDPDESGLICINEAIRSNWAKQGDSSVSGQPLNADAMPVIVMMTPSDTKPVEQQAIEMPSDTSALINRPYDFNDLTSRWNSSNYINQERKSLFLFTNKDNPAARSCNLCGIYNSYDGTGLDIKYGRTATWDQLMSWNATRFAAYANAEANPEDAIIDMVINRVQEINSGSGNQNSSANRPRLLN